MKTKIKEIYAYLSVKFTSFIQQNAQQIAFTIAIMLVLLLTTLMFSLSANSISFAEIEKNSQKWQELEQVRITKESELNSLIENQKDLEVRNSLLRQLFSSAENQK